VDFTPVFQETVDRIRARVNADANAGIDPLDPSFLDTTPGGFWFDITQALVLELDRLWDALGSEVVAASFPAYAWGTYLDEHGLTVGLIRKDAAPAVGSVTFTGAAGTLLATGVQVGTQQTAPDADPVAFATTAPATIPVGGTIVVPVQAVEAGTAGNVAALAVSVLLSPVSGITAVSNVQAISAGADVESDEAFRDRVLLAYQGAQGSGTVADYLSWALSYPGVGNASVFPLWAGAGTVRVIVTDDLNRPVPGAVVTGLQNLLDPVAGQGRGLAPIGATVTVATPTTLTVNVTATVVTASGYSLTGTAGTIAVGPAATTAVRAFIDSLAPGQTVVLEAVKSRFFSIPGIVDVTAATLNAVAANLTVGATQVALTGTVVLS
jgi:uncharacterized phage protein gp47/JayE